MAHTITLNQALADIDELHYRMELAAPNDDFITENPADQVEARFMEVLIQEYGDDYSPQQLFIHYEAVLQGMEAEARDYDIELDY